MSNREPGQRVGEAGSTTGTPGSGEAGSTRVIVSDMAFGESVRWHEGRVWFCDWVDGDVISVAPDGSDRRVHAHLDGAPICIDWRPDGGMLVVDGASHLLLQHDDTHGLNVVADVSDISDRPWNEVAAHPSGRAYVNGIGFDMMGGEQPTTGQIAVAESDGEVRQVADGLEFPNGMVISPDGETLLVAESYAGRITAFTITGDGSLTDRRAFAEIEGSAPDGISLAPDGSLWYADVPNQHCRRVAQGGSVLETIDVDRGCFSCAISPTGTLYIAATVWDEHTFTSRSGVVLAVETEMPS